MICRINDLPGQRCKKNNYTDRPMAGADRPVGMIASPTPNVLARTIRVVPPSHFPRCYKKMCTAGQGDETSRLLSPPYPMPNPIRGGHCRPCRQARGRDERQCTTLPWHQLAATAAPATVAGSGAAYTRRQRRASSSTSGASISTNATRQPFDQERATVSYRFTVIPCASGQVAQRCRLRGRG